MVRAYLYGSLALAVAFVALPIGALMLEVTPGAVREQLGSAEARAALLISLETSLAALALVVAFGTPVAYLLATRELPGRRALTTLFELPLVLPPSAAGIALLAAFGSAGLLGAELGALGVELKLTKAAVVMALAFVASPLYIRQAQTAFGAVDVRLVEAARVLGASPVRRFCRVELPLAAEGLAAGAAMAWARGLGEFGATMIFAGSLAGETRNLTLLIYETLDRDFRASVAQAAVLIALSLTVLVAARLLLPDGRRRAPRVGRRRWRAVLARRVELSDRRARRAGAPPRAEAPARAPRSTPRTRPGYQEG